MTSKEVFVQLLECVKVFDPKVDKQKLGDAIDILNIFVKREKEDGLCKQVIEMLKRLQDFISSLDWIKYNFRTEEQKNIGC